MTEIMQLVTQIEFSGSRLIEGMFSITEYSIYGRRRGNSTVVSISVCQAGSPGSRSARSACVSKVEFYHCVIDSFSPVPKTG